jgi:hypothetical protein
MGTWESQLLSLRILGFSMENVPENWNYLKFGEILRHRISTKYFYIKWFMDT